jgi:uncharacterized membrane protein (DUF485 family)
VFSLGRHRNAIIIGAACVILSFIYYFFAPILGYKVEWAGVTMLAALGIALGLLVGVLDTGE